MVYGFGDWVGIRMSLLVHMAKAKASDVKRPLWGLVTGWCQAEVTRCVTSLCGEVQRTDCVGHWGCSVTRMGLGDTHISEPGRRTRAFSPTYAAHTGFCRLGHQGLELEL